jgi:LuxR family maltose regulon positive regulatory protein
VPLVDSLPGIARPWLMSLVAEELVRCACDLGDVPAAERALAQVRGGLAVSLARAHVLVARGESAAARAALADLEPTALLADSPARALEVAVLRHLTATTSRELADALALATDIAATHGLARSLDAALRRSVRAAQPAAAATAAGAGAAHEPLSARELEVLRLLPSDLPNAELASELFVSLNTLKTHMKSVYRKLGATSRADAVRRGRELGVLPPRP